MNLQVNGYFICDEGRLSYKGENEGRLTEARQSGKARSQDDVLAAAQQEIDRAGEKTVILLSPDCSLEQMVAVKALAVKLGCFLSGFSDGYIEEGDGDDLLIQDDKSANRVGLKLLDIDCRREGFVQAIGEGQLFLNFNNELNRSVEEVELKNLLKGKKIVMAASHDNPLAAMADLAVPVATPSEYDGCLINCDNILQSFIAAVRKNHQPMDIATLAVKLGSPLKNRAEQFAELSKYLGVLKDYEADTLPAEGLKLTDSEAANVTA